MILASCGTTQHRCCWSDWYAPITRYLLWQIRCRLWEDRFIGPGCCRRLSPNLLEANRIYLEALSQTNRAAHLSYLQQVEEGMSGWTFEEEASVYYPGTELSETTLSRSPPVGDCGCGCCEDFQDLAAIRKFWSWQIYLPSVGWDGFEEICKWGLEGDTKANVRDQATGDGFCRAHGHTKEG